jgi:hypothetical protein
MSLPAPCAATNTALLSLAAGSNTAEVSSPSTVMRHFAKFGVRVVIIHMDKSLHNNYDPDPEFFSPP